MSEEDHHIEENKQAKKLKKGIPLKKEEEGYETPILEEYRIPKVDLSRHLPAPRQKRVFLDMA